MPIPILMPALSPTMETGKLAKWHVKEGDEIAPGDVIAEIETDKAVMEVEAIEEGRIGKLYIPEGDDDVPVNTTIAMVLSEDEVLGDENQAAVKQPAAKPEVVGADQALSAASSAQEAVTHNATPQVQASGNTARIFASPLARRIAKENGISITDVKGTGPNGRIVKKDVESRLSSGGLETAAALGTAAAVGSSLAATKAAIGAAKPPAGLDDKEIFSIYEEGSYEVVPHDNMRRIIADRLTLAKTTIPHFYLSIDCELDELLTARKRMNDAVAADGVRLSVNDFIIKALALALQKVPEANATWSSQGVLKHKRSDVAVAVAVEGGLFTPVIRHADLKDTIRDFKRDERSGPPGPQ